MSTPEDTPSPARSSARILAAWVLDSIASLPPQEQQEAIARLIADCMATMDVPTIQRIRAEIVESLDVEIPVVRNTLDLIDGHLALREMGLAGGGEAAA